MWLSYMGRGGLSCYEWLKHNNSLCLPLQKHNLTNITLCLNVGNHDVLVASTGVYFLEK